MPLNHVRPDNSEGRDIKGARVGTLTLGEIAGIKDKAVDERLASYGLDPAKIAAAPASSYASDEARTLMIKRFAIARLEGHREEEIQDSLRVEVPMGWKGRETGFPTYHLRSLFSEDVKHKIKEHEEFCISAAALKGDEQIRELMAVIKKITFSHGKAGLAAEQFFKSMVRLPPYEGPKVHAKEVIDLHSFLVAYILAMGSLTNVNNAFHRYLSDEAWGRLPTRVGGDYTSEQ